MKVLLVTAIPLTGDNQYPHQSAVFNMLNNDVVQTDYYHAKQRGLTNFKFIKRIRNNWKSPKVYFEIVKLFEDFFPLRALKNRYDRVIVVDNHLYIIAKLAGFKNVVLWSHDFLSYDNIYYDNFIDKTERMLFCLLWKKSDKLIIQDESRLELFLKSQTLKVLKDKVFFLPVSLFDVSKIEDVKHKIKNCNQTAIIRCIQIGGINSERSQSDKLIRIFETLGNRYYLTLHGYIRKDIVELEIGSNIFLSNTITTPNNIPNVVSDFQIGIICYNIDDLNFELISHASNQFVEFIRLGIPVLVYGNSNLGKYVVLNCVGQQVEFSEKSTSEKIENILKDYEKFSTNSFQLFRNKFDLNLYKSHLIDFLIKI